MNMLSLYRRQFLVGTAATCAIDRPEVSARERDRSVIAGAIRWDAWYKKMDYSVYAQDALSPLEYRGRAPRHCTISSTGSISCTGTQAVMDLEIQAAAQAGLHFWAFVWYGPDTSFRTAWNLYQSSDYREKINWCGILSIDEIGKPPFSSNSWRSTMQEWSEHLLSPTYQKIDLDVGPARPVLFLLWQQGALKAYFDGQLSKLAEALRYLKELVTKGGAGAPYFVLLDGVDGAPIVPIIGAQAIGSYIAAFRSEREGSYRDLDTQVRAYWTKLAKTGLPIVPIAMVGWDTRARREHPGPWQNTAHLDQYYALSQPIEFQDHLRAAVTFVTDNIRSCPSRLLLIYSWDECDEGGCLMPTIGDPQGFYLKAIAPVLR
jgi:hypothetical protein